MIQDDVMNKETRNENVSCFGGQADKIPFRKRYDQRNGYFNRKTRRGMEIEKSAKVKKNNQ